MMIAISSGLFTMDTARVAAQIVTGVGFLGASALLQTKKQIRGLTTAATIWLVAAIGMADGKHIRLSRTREWDKWVKKT